ncbi:hypothetical protein RND81_11G069200 [Saponaria officinalis]|uniref:Uncharacterized protein n=1 Tax=Saponaria officinalis TaxID=3572 RepID=A0AAW1HIU5_SAPOF
MSNKMSKLMRNKRRGPKKTTSVPKNPDRKPNNPPQSMTEQHPTRYCIYDTLIDIVGARLFTPDNPNIEKQCAKRNPKQTLMTQFIGKTNPQKLGKRPTSSKLKSHIRLQKMLTNSVKRNTQA